MKIHSLFLSAATLAFAVLPSVNAQTVIQTSLTAPTPGASDISNLGAVGDIDGDQDYSDNTAAPGQSFTTLGSAVRFNLSSIIVQGNGDAGTSQGINYAASTYTLSVFSITAGVATPLVSQAFVFSDTTGATNYSARYLSFNLTTPLVVTANTQYAYSIQGSAGGFYGFAGSGAAGGVIPGKGGQAIGVNGAAVVNYAYTRNFDVRLTSVPEPSTWALLLVGTAGLALAWKRRSAGSLA